LQPLSDSQREMLEEATTSYQEAVSDEALAYLDARGIDVSTAGSFRLGVVEDPAPEHVRFRGMLSIPYLDRENKALTLRFRCIQNHDHRDHYHGKYNSVKGDVPRMFNVRAIHRAADVIHVCEGEMDAIVLEMLGLDAVAIAGASMWQPYQRRMLAGFNRVWMWADRDGDPDSEQNAGERLLTKITTSVRTAKPVRLPAGDVGETLLQYGPEYLLSLIEPKAKAA
jgi:DNA primase